MKRFDGDDPDEFQLETETIHDLIRAEEIFAQAADREQIGISIYEENDRFWAGLSVEAAADLSFTGRRIYNEGVSAGSDQPPVCFCGICRNDGDQRISGRIEDKRRNTVCI